MESNKPINKIESNESIWNGVGIGILAGAGGAGAVRMAPSISDSMLKNKASRMGKKGASMQMNSKEWNDHNFKYQKFEEKANKKVARNNNMRGAYKGWGGLAIGGSSALVGGIAGGVIDHYS